MKIRKTKMWPNKLGCDYYKDGKKVLTIGCNPLSMQQLEMYSPMGDKENWTKYFDQFGSEVAK